MGRTATTVAFSPALLLVAASAYAGGYNWRDHAPPYEFLFGNHIDTHQQTRQNKDGSLQGFFYVVQLDEDGDLVPDTTEDGYPIMRHCTMDAHYPDCQVGWKLTAVPCIDEVNGCTAMFLYHQHDHPVWLVCPRERMTDGEVFTGGSRDCIPQPGAPAHFHWLTEGIEPDFPSSIEQVEALLGVDIAVPEECNVVTASELTPGQTCPGYFFELQVVGVSRVYRVNQGAAWAFHHGGENIIVRPGTDIATHINFVTSYVADGHDGGMGGGGSH